MRLTSRLRCCIVLCVAALLGACRTTRNVPDPVSPLRPASVTCDRAGADADADGLSDACELELAQAFAPILVVDRRDCLWNADAGRLDGGYLFVAQPVGDVVRVAFLTAYYRDCGWSGPRCWFRGAGCGGHAGDSEVIAVDVRQTADGWLPTGVFLSAHCGGASAGACRWYRDDALARFRWGAGAAYGPEVWVARDKHAHYPTREACETGHWRQERCATAPARGPFTVERARQNLGARGNSSYGTAGCVSVAARPVSGAGADPRTEECFWQDSIPFRGWQGVWHGPPPQAYGRVLAALGF